ncbi:MAG: hydroxymethylbilane synthase [Blastocatellia bacterium]
MVEQITIGTRGSQLALWQTNWVKDEIRRRHPGVEVIVKVISTKGDRVLDVSLPKLGEQGKGLFTKELEEAILEGRVDLAVHSLKDLPTELPPGLQIGAFCEREDVRDALVAREGILSFDDLPKRACLGTSSLRRQAQLLAARRDLLIQPVRGNVDTRLRKLERGEFDAVVLAAAGLHRLGYTTRITQYFAPDFIVPAVGQGALAIETRKNDTAVNEIVLAVDHELTRLACIAERAFLKGLGGGCLVPIAAHAEIEAGLIRLTGLVANPDGSEAVRGDLCGPLNNAEALGQELANDLLSRGVGRILASA